MNPAELQQPIRDSGIRSINFFNGRLLTARDLTREQTANREVDKQLGQAIGDGVAFGFEVSKSKSTQSTTASPLLTITPGLAINRRGQTLQLESETDIALVRDANGNTGVASAFNECLPSQTGTFIAGAGVYLLTVAPAQTTEGLATVAGLDRAIASCNTDTIVSTLQFRLVQLNPPLTDAELDDENHLRNLVAYKCFGVEDLRTSVSDPFGTDLTRYGLLDSLRPNRLTNCDVPLAVLYWTLAGGVKFVDMWSVRRSPARLDRGGWCNFIDDRSGHEGEAKFLQFQEQIVELRQSIANPRDVAAIDHFNYLPAVGVIQKSTSGQIGFDHRRFFQNQTYREPVFIEGARLEHLIRDSVSYAPIKLGTGELIYLYEVRQNAQAIDAGGARVPQSYLIFSSGHMPFYGEARFDVNRFDYSNYSTVYD
ncbi:MAG TPA: hypothetical protein VFI24_27295 [Pyrinomonadaceae bacterium]|nr:hypothetical protein [Pyrinomonadaceae bacterium]